MPIKSDEHYFFEQGEVFLFPSVHAYNADGGAIYDLCVPAFTICEAFAAEAYLKSLIWIQTGKRPPRIHNLHKLFSQISSNSRKAVQDEWTARHAWSVLNVSSGNAPDGTPYEISIPSSFEEALAQSAETFIKFRYNFYEHHAWHMRALPYLIRRQILIARPDWKPEFGSYLARLDPHPDYVKPRQPKPQHSRSMKFSDSSNSLKVSIRYNKPSRE